MPLVIFQNAGWWIYGFTEFHNQISVAPQLPGGSFGLPLLAVWLCGKPTWTCWWVECSGLVMAIEQTMMIFKMQVCQSNICTGLESEMNVIFFVRFPFSLYKNLIQVTVCIKWSSPKNLPKYWDSTSLCMKLSCHFPPFLLGFFCWHSGDSVIFILEALRLWPLHRGPPSPSQDRPRHQLAQRPSALFDDAKIGPTEGVTHSWF